MCFSIGIYSCPMDPMDSIGTTFHPLIQHERNFSKSLTNRKWTFPSESIRFQWIRWTPSERLSTPSSNMSGIILSLSGIENEIFHRNLFVSNGSDWLHRNNLDQLWVNGCGYNFRRPKPLYTFQILGGYFLYCVWRKDKIPRILNILLRQRKLNRVNRVVSSMMYPFPYLRIL